MSEKIEFLSAIDLNLKESAQTDYFNDQKPFFSRFIFSWNSAFHWIKNWSLKSECIYNNKYQYQLSPWEKQSYEQALMFPKR
jgi:hypothetical protein